MMNNNNLCLKRLILTFTCSSNTRASAHGSWFSLLKSIFVPFLSRQIADLVTKKKFWMFGWRLAAHDFDWNYVKIGINELLPREIYIIAFHVVETIDSVFLHGWKFSTRQPQMRKTSHKILYCILMHGVVAFIPFFLRRVPRVNNESKAAFDGRCQSISSEDRCQESIYRLCAMTLLCVCLLRLYVSDLR